MSVCRLNAIRFPRIQVSMAMLDFGKCARSLCVFLWLIPWQELWCPSPPLLSVWQTPCLLTQKIDILTDLALINFNGIWIQHSNLFEVCWTQLNPNPKQFRSSLLCVLAVTGIGRKMPVIVHGVEGPSKFCLRSSVFFKHNYFPVLKPPFGNFWSSMVTVCPSFVYSDKRWKWLSLWPS